jgi:hypothetical protein
LIELLNAIAPYLDVVAPLVALFFAVFRKECRLEEHSFIVFYIFLQLFLNGWTKVLMYQRIENTFVYQINYVASLAIISAYFLAKYRKISSRQSWWLVLVFSTLSVLIALVIAITENVSIFNSRSSSFVTVIIILHNIVYYYLKLLSPKAEKITKTRSFWFVTGLFCYYTGTFFIVTSYQYFIKHHAGVKFSTLWSMHNVLFLLMCISFSIGFSCKKYQTT